MQVARLIVRVVQLECPHCHETMKDPKGREASIHADRSEIWDKMASAPLTCDACGLSFRLPANPFQKAS